MRHRLCGHALLPVWLSRPQHTNKYCCQLGSADPSILLTTTPPAGGAAIGLVANTLTAAHYMDSSALQALPVLMPMLCTSFKGRLQYSNRTARSLSRVLTVCLLNTSPTAVATADSWCFVVCMCAVCGGKDYFLPPASNKVRTYS